MIFLTIAYLLLVAILIYREQLHRKHRSQMMRQAAQPQMNYIHILLETMYTYNHNPVLLHRNLSQEMTAAKLLAYGIVEDRGASIFTPEMKINKKDQQIYQLFEQEGFSSREICVLFGLNNLNTFYVKYHRINKKLKKTTTSDCKEEPSKTQ